MNINIDILEQLEQSEPCWCYGKDGWAAEHWNDPCWCENCRDHEVIADEEMCCECHD